jgi:hypothetical protein
MSFDNPSRKASPWTTLKRTVKTKSLRFVRLASPFQPIRKVQFRAWMVTQVSQSWSIQKIVYELTGTQPSLQGTRFA